MLRLSAKLGLALFFLCGTSFASSDIIDNISAYHNNSKWQKLSAQETFEAFAKKHNIQGNEHLLDLCSGDGRVSSYFLEQLPNGYVHGVDKSKLMVDFANDRYANDKMSFTLMDVQKLPFDKDYDLITSFTCLHLVPDMQSTFNGMNQSLKPGGKILLQFPYDHGLRHAIDATLESPRWKPYFVDFNAPWYFHNPQTYKKMINKANLTPLRVEITQMHEVYISRGEFQTSVSHWMPHVKHLAEPLRDEFMEDLVDKYLSYMPTDEKGYVHYFVDRIEIEAQKPLS